MESDAKTYFAFSASLRIFSEIPDLNKITKQLGIQPTRTHRKGDKAGPRSRGYPHDMWSYQVPLDEAEPLEKHIVALWDKFKNKKKYLLDLKRKLKVDVFLGYRSNCDHAGVQVSHTALKMFTELQIPFGISIIIA